nr:ferric reductase-like transmembrane domain-containing protein [Ameyamaea chiangmaiensis]
MWDAGAAAGTIGLLLLLAVFALSARPARWPRCGGKFFLVLHRWLGTGAAVAVGLHVVAMFAAVPFAVMLRYVEPGAPWYMLAGVGSALGALGAVLTALPAWRRRVFGDARRFRHAHMVLGSAVLLLAAWHAMGTGFHLETRVRLILCAAAVAAGLALSARRAWGPAVAPGPGPGRRVHAVSGARLIAGGVFVLAVAGGAVFAGLPHHGGG